MKEILDRIKAMIPDIDVPEGADLQQLIVDSENKREGDLHLEDGYECSFCKNRGFITLLGENGYPSMRECKCKKIRATLKRAKRSGLGDILKDFSFNKFEATDSWQKEIKEKAQRFCTDEDAKWFYIGGQVGSGKTHICTAIASYYIKAGKEVRYMLWAEDSKFLKANVNENVYTEKMADLKNADVLYIDDFLKVKQGEVPTPADINIAFEIINHRLMSNDKITVISSEKQLNEVMDYDEATMSRIFQKTGPYKFSIAKDRTKNYRLKG